MKRSILFSAILIAICSAPVAAETFYVRTDGGTAAQCNGKADTAKNSSGVCAWVNPMLALTPSGDKDRKGTTRITANSTLYIQPGEYRIGYGGPGAESCATAYPWDCHMPPPPDGVTILGPGAKLVGVERNYRVLDVSGTNGVTIDGLEITDGEACGDNLGSKEVQCDRDTDAGFPYGDWASVGIYGLKGSNLVIKNVNIHGMANRGVMLAGYSNLSILHSKINGNAWAGFDGDLNGGKNNPYSNSGTILFDSVEVKNNGCIEGSVPLHCYAQNNAGYGDGIAAYYSGGDWILRNLDVENNTSDGADLLYLDGTGSLLVEGGVYGGNSGNQLKTNGKTTINHATIHADCFAQDGIEGMKDGDNCRALGNGLSIGITANAPVTVDSSMFDMGEGDCQIIIGGANSGSFSLTNSNIVGGNDRHGGDKTCGFYADNTSAATYFAGNIWANVKDGTAPANSGTAPDPTPTPTPTPTPMQCPDVSADISELRAIIADFKVGNNSMLGRQKTQEKKAKEGQDIAQQQDTRIDDIRAKINALQNKLEGK